MVILPTDEAQDGDGVREEQDQEEGEEGCMDGDGRGMIAVCTQPRHHLAARMVNRRRDGGGGR